MTKSERKSRIEAAKAQGIINDLCLKIDVLAGGIKAVRELMDDSLGVCGLHQNGDIARWEELQNEGEFGEWLLEFNNAERAIQESTKEEDIK